MIAETCQNRQPGRSATWLRQCEFLIFRRKNSLVRSLMDSHKHVKHRDQEQSDTARCDHADEHRRAHSVPRSAMRRSPRPGTSPRMNAIDVIRTGAETHFGAERYGIFKAQSLLALFLGELTDQDGVLRCCQLPVCPPEIGRQRIRHALSPISIPHPRQGHRVAARRRIYAGRLAGITSPPPVGTEDKTL